MKFFFLSIQLFTRMYNALHTISKWNMSHFGNSLAKRTVIFLVLFFRTFRHSEKELAIIVACQKLYLFFLNFKNSYHNVQHMIIFFICWCFPIIMLSKQLFRAIQKICIRRSEIMFWAYFNIILKRNEWHITSQISELLKLSSSECHQCEECAEFWSFTQFHEMMSLL